MDKKDKYQELDFKPSFLLLSIMIICGVILSILFYQPIKLGYKFLKFLYKNFC